MGRATAQRFLLGIIKRFVGKFFRNICFHSLRNLRTSPAGSVFRRNLPFYTNIIKLSFACDSIQEKLDIKLVLYTGIQNHYNCFYNYKCNANLLKTIYYYFYYKRNKYLRWSLRYYRENGFTYILRIRQ